MGSVRLPCWFFFLSFFFISLLFFMCLSVYMSSLVFLCVCVCVHWMICSACGFWFACSLLLLFRIFHVLSLSIYFELVQVLASKECIWRKMSCCCALLYALQPTCRKLDLDDSCVVFFMLMAYLFRSVIFFFLYFIQYGRLVLHDERILMRL